MYRVNLLTPEAEGSAYVRRSAGLWTWTGRAAALLLAVGYGLFLLAFHMSGLQLMRQQSALELLEPEIRAALELRADRERAEARLGAWREAANHGGEWVDVLGQVTGALPADVWLTSLRLVRGEEDTDRPGRPGAAVVRLEGAGGSLSSVGLFLHSLQRRPCFSSAQLQTARESKDGVLVFAIDLRLAGDGRGVAFE
ncbi:MAG: PilN domain-containing protein [Bacillota bacterium]